MRKHQHKPARIVEICGCGCARINGEEWSGPDAPNPLAQALASRYVAQTTHAERSEKSKRAAASRWAGRAKEKAAFIHAMASRPRPGGRIADRCPCGKYSRWHAAKRGHKCNSTSNN